MKKTMLMLAALMAGLTGCREKGRSTEDLAAVAEVDPGRYAGVWYEIARLPNRFEEGLDEVTATYEPLEGGGLRVINRGRKAGKLREVTGRARAADPEKPGSGELEVSFFWPFYGAYRILYLAEDYSLAVVTSSTRDYLWILARKPVLPPAALQPLLERAAVMGFAVEKLEYPSPVQE